MQLNNVMMTIVINASRDHIAREFISPYDRQTYIEGREGSNFSIRLENKNNYRVLAIPSVDGLSVLDGEPAGEGSPGYILDANQTLDIPGWVVDKGTAAKFFFSGLKADGGDDSYVVQSGQGPANKGIIGLKVFSEKNGYSNFRSGSPRLMRSATFGATAKGIATPLGSAPRGIDPWPQGSFTVSHSATPTWNSASDVLMGSVASASSVADSVPLSDELERGIAPAQTLGTGFGEATDFNTTKAEFQRGDLLCQMLIYYDDKRGLKKRGIDVAAPTVTRPSAFPADEPTGCKTPAGWKR